MAETKTITSLIDALAEKMKTVSEQGAALVDVFRKQAAALGEMKSAAESVSTAIGGLGGIASQDTWTGTGGWDGISKWDMPGMVGASLARSSNALIVQAQAAISSGQEINMQNAINSMLTTIEGTQKLIDSAKIQYDAAMAANNTQKALNIKQTSIDINKKYIENAKTQIDRIGAAMTKILPQKTYRLEMKYNAGAATPSTQYIDVVGYEQAMAMIGALGNAARLV